MDFIASPDGILEPQASALLLFGRPHVFLILHQIRSLRSTLLAGSQHFKRCLSFTSLHISLLLPARHVRPVLGGGGGSCFLIAVFCFLSPLSSIQTSHDHLLMTWFLCSSLAFGVCSLGFIYVP